MHRVSAHVRPSKHQSIADAWHILASQHLERRRLREGQQRAAARGEVALLPLPPEPPPAPIHRFEWVPTEPRQRCALCGCQTDLALLGERVQRLWWVGEVVTDQLPSCGAVEPPSAATTAAADPEAEEQSKPSRPRRPRARQRAAKPVTAPRPSHRPSKETQAFLDGEDPELSTEVDTATLKAFERESVGLGITHEDIAGERELALIVQAQLDAGAIEATMKPAIDAAKNGDSEALMVIWSYPVLAKARKAANTLLSAHDKLIRMYAARCSKMTGSRHGVDFDDLLQEARRGFLHGIMKFKPQHGVKLSTYAAYWMLQTMGRTLDKTRGLVTLPFNVIERAKRAQKKGLAITAATLTAAGKTELNQEIAECAAAVWSGRDISVNETVGGSASDEDESAALKIAGYLQSDEDVEERVGDAEIAGRRAEMVRRAVSTLTDREQEVARRRLMTDPPDSLEEIGRALGMTRENVRLIEAKVAEKIRATLVQMAEQDELAAEMLPEAGGEANDNAWDDEEDLASAA